MNTTTTRKIDRRTVARILSQQPVCLCGSESQALVRSESGLVAICTNCLAYGYPTN